MKNFIKNFANGFMNCVKSMDFWCMTFLTWAICGYPVIAYLTGDLTLFKNAELYQHDMSLCAFGGTMLLIGAIAQWAIIMTEKDSKLN